MMAFKKLFF